MDDANPAHAPGAAGEAATPKEGHEPQALRRVADDGMTAPRQQEAAPAPARQEEEPQTEPTAEPVPSDPTVTMEPAEAEAEAEPRPAAATFLYAPPAFGPVAAVPVRYDPPAGEAPRRDGPLRDWIPAVAPSPPAERRAAAPAVPSAQLPAPVQPATAPPDAGYPAWPFPVPSRDRVRELAYRAGRYALIAALGLGMAVLVLIALYRWVNPPYSALMLGQRLTGTPITQRWVPLERISPNLVNAVITSEDGGFCRHWGVDWGELSEAIERARDGIPRGGSTISMQVVKNLFLWPSKSYVRKAIEIPLTFTTELAWPKRRILEVYLNIAEWGPGIFGAEAAARYHFRKSAAFLTPREAALLAVSLPNPFDRRAGSPGPGTQRLADNLLMRMRTAPRNSSCVRGRGG